MRDIVIGVAGHIDHGKSSLIKAMTGFDGDTTHEEKRRGITIDLSFSNMSDGSTNISFIDVPGHEKLVKNMIAGAFGFDAVMVVVDAVEGLMPQTIEHFSILNLLKVKDLIVVITKIDLASNEQLETTIKKSKKRLEEFDNLTLLEIVPVSIHNNATIDLLKNKLLKIDKSDRVDNGLFRCYVDRSFGIKGAGNIITGTVLSGCVELGEKIWLSQEASLATVKSIQVHSTECKSATVSQRVALNLQLKKSSPARGELLTKKGFLRGFKSIDVELITVAGAQLKHNSSVEFFIGSRQISGRVLLFTDSRFARVEFAEQVFCIFAERFIITQAGRVVAGGEVLIPINDPIKRKAKIPLLSALALRDFKQAFKILIENHKKGFGIVSSTQRFDLSHAQALHITNEINDIFVDEKALVIYPISTMNQLKMTIHSIYQNNPKAMLSAKSLALKIKWASESMLQAILDGMLANGDLRLAKGIYVTPDSQIDDIKEYVKSQIFTILQASGITPEAPYNIYDDLDIDAKMGDNALKTLTSSKKVARLSHNLFITHQNLSSLVAKMREIIATNGYIDIANFKEHYPVLSRKYLVAYLEYLDNFSDIKKESNRRFLS